MPIKSYKGMDSNMQCRGFQYEVGKTYETDKAAVCENGFHACEYPLDIFRYYPPGESRFFEVEQSGEISKDADDSKVSSTKIKIIEEIGISGLVEAAVEYVKSRTTAEHADQERATAGICGAATAGRREAATAGRRGAATAGICGAAAAGRCGAAIAGNYGVAAAGICGAATAGRRGAAIAGIHGAATAGIYGAATAGSYGVATSKGSSSSGRRGLSVVRGGSVKARGGIGAVLVIAIENSTNYCVQHLKAVTVDGEKVKADTWYTLDDNGELVEAAE